MKLYINHMLSLNARLVIPFECPFITFLIFASSIFHILILISVDTVKQYTQSAVKSQSHTHPPWPDKV